MTVAHAFRKHHRRASGPGRGPDEGRRDLVDVEPSWAARVDALAGGLASWACGRGDTVALMLGNRPEFHLADLAVMTLGATPFSIYRHVRLSRSSSWWATRGREGRIDRGRVRRSLPRSWSTCWCWRTAGRRSRGSRPPRWPSPTTRHADLHVGHHGAAEGRPAHARSLMAAIGTVDGIIEFPDGAKVISWLPAAHIAERMAHHYLPIALAMTVTMLPEPARGRRVSAGGQADVVLRRAADLGEAQGRASRPISWPAITPSGSRRPCGRSSWSRRGSRCPTSSLRWSRRPIARSSPGCGRCSASTRRRL